jgi:branched-chain amino acid transport system ATP-binding protein
MRSTSATSADRSDRAAAAGEASADPVLQVERLEAGYPGKQILFGIDFALEAGEVVALLGANGSGKSTALAAVVGLVRPRRGTIRFAGEVISGQRPHRIMRRGISLVSQARDLFPDMTVAENLALGASHRNRSGAAAALDQCFTLFPRLAERRRQLVKLMSGGEQQMVAISRALMAAPRLLLLDEPSGGLAPRFVAEIAAALRQLNATGVTMLIVEQNIGLALAVARRLLVLRDGQVAEQAARGSEAEIVRSIYL